VSLDLEPLVGSGEPPRGDGSDVAASSESTGNQLSTFRRECSDRGYQLELSPRQPRNEFPGVLRCDVTNGGRDVWHGYLAAPYDRAIEQARRDLNGLHERKENGRPAEIQPGAETPVVEITGWRRLRGATRAARRSR
jgi:hypothetical protein